MSFQLELDARVTPHLWMLNWFTLVDICTYSTIVHVGSSQVHSACNHKGSCLFVKESHHLLEYGLSNVPI